MKRHALSLFSVFALASSLLFSPVAADELFNDDIELNCQPACISPCKGKRAKESVFASFRLTQELLVVAGQNVPFNVEDSNQGEGIAYDTASKTFQVKKTGFYLINFGVQTVNIASPPSGQNLIGVNLIQSRNGTIIKTESALRNSPAATIISLTSGDTIFLTPPRNLGLLFATLSTYYNDSAFITFVRM